MEITLEKIELVKDRTGVTYKEAKEALEAADGSVVDAIIRIEENIDFMPSGKIGNSTSAVIDKIKEAIKKGNVAKIVVKKDGDIVLNLPVNIGILGTVLAPWAVIAGTIMALGTKCEIELVKEDGEVVNIADRASETFDAAKSKGSVIKDEFMEKGGDAFTSAKSIAADVIDKVKSKVDDSDAEWSFDIGEDEDFESSVGIDTNIKDEFTSSDTSFTSEEEADQDFFDLDWVKKAAGTAEDKVEDFSEDIEEKAENAGDTLEAAAERFGEKFERMADATKSKAEGSENIAKEVAAGIEEAIVNADEDDPGKKSDIFKLFKF